MVYCEHCDRTFPHAKALFQHPQHSSANHPYCDSCVISFSSEDELTRHFDQQHYYCFDCEEVFWDESDFIKHGSAYHHVCHSCVRIFSTSRALADHKEAKHYYCRDCDRLFKSEAILAAHRASSTHAPKSFVCPGFSCGKVFVSISALILHAESGTCKSGITRKFINSRLAEIDSHNIITDPSRMIGGGTEVEYWATERSWNGSGYECILCNAEFRTLISLNQHLKSPRHFQPMYHCPKRGCNIQFTVLSALCQHVEWSSCGARQTKVVQDAVQHLTRGMKTISL